MKIVVIDDESSIRSVIRELLEINGHDIFEADNGNAGLELIRATLPDLILCDINMPEMNGDELFDTLRASESELNIIPFIFISGDVTTNELIKRLNKGADNCFEKPFNLSLLAAHVNSHQSRVSRVSAYINDKLDIIADSLPATIEHDFSSYTSLTLNTSGYVSAIVSAMHDYQTAEAGQPSPENGSDIAGIGASQSGSDQYTVSTEISYIQYCLDRFNDRRKLVRSANGEDLSWTLIFIVVHAQLQAAKIYVSDLYVSIPSAKSTINARISSLIDDDVLAKVGDSTDGRRQQILLTERFSSELMVHIDSSIKRIKKLVC
ncbi:MAG: response regulator [Gammaproteobacteria bacterium]|nr:response regulator [Gammaproteobacteria bacterium]